MLRYLLRRTGLMVPPFIAVTFLSFLLIYKARNINHEGAKDTKDFTKKNVQSTG